MLKFFRKIRKSLIESGSTGKPGLSGAERYLFYATGEIALVVIGILIALQVNNWNSHRIELHTLKNNLAYAIEDVEVNKEILSALKKERLNALIKCSEAIDAYKNSSPISFSEFMQQYGPIVVEQSFKMKNQGIERVKSSSIYESNSLVEIRDLIRDYEALIEENKYTESKLNTHTEAMEQELFSNGFYDSIWDHLRFEFINPGRFEEPTEDPDILNTMKEFGSLVGIFLRYEIESPIIVREYDRIIAKGDTLNMEIAKFLDQ